LDLWRRVCVRVEAQAVVNRAGTKSRSTLEAAARVARIADDVDIKAILVGDAPR
jgi:hypothetical protein